MQFKEQNSMKNTFSIALVQKTTVKVFALIITVVRNKIDEKALMQKEPTESTDNDE